MRSRSWGEGLKVGKGPVQTLGTPAFRDRKGKTGHEGGWQEHWDRILSTLWGAFLRISRESSK